MTTCCSVSEHCLAMYIVRIATSPFRKKNYGQENFGKSLAICQILPGFSPSKILYCTVVTHKGVLSEVVSYKVS